MIDLEKPYTAASEREERFIEKCRAKEADIWLELQDEDWAEKFAYAHIGDTNRMLGEIFAIVAKYKVNHNLLTLKAISDKLDQEVENVVEFQTKMEG